MQKYSNRNMQNNSKICNEKYKSNMQKYAEICKTIYAVIYTYIFPAINMQIHYMSIYAMEIICINMHKYAIYTMQ